MLWKETKQNKAGVRKLGSFLLALSPVDLPRSSNGSPGSVLGAGTRSRSVDAWVLHLARYVRRVGLEGSTAEGRVGAVLRLLPGAVATLNELVDSRGSVHQIRDPGVPISSEFLNISHAKAARAAQVYSPAGLNVRCVVFGLLVVDPSCPNCTESFSFLTPI